MDDPCSFPMDGNNRQLVGQKWKLKRVIMDDGSSSPLEVTNGQSVKRYWKVKKLNFTH
jgi:hypothetical protein